MQLNPPVPFMKEKIPSRSALVSRNIVVGGRRTSVRLEPDMWNAISEVSQREHLTIHEICTMVAGRRGVNSSLASSLRIFVLAYFRAAATDEGHVRAGHGATTQRTVMAQQASHAPMPSAHMLNGLSQANGHDKKLPNSNGQDMH